MSGSKNGGTFTQWNTTQQKEGALTLCYSTNGSAEHYAKWNKPGESQISYDLTYKWNLINKTNKQAVYNERHWNKEQTDSNHRGRQRGIRWKNRGRAISLTFEWRNVKPGEVKQVAWGCQLGSASKPTLLALLSAIVGLFIYSQSSCPLSTLPHPGGIVLNKRDQIPEEMNKQMTHRDNFRCW